MRPSTFKKTVLATNIALLLGSAFSMSAIAADADATAAADENIEKIEVRGIRASQAANLNSKRFADGTVDAISAEDIGKFPDKNVAETLARIPGVTIDRTFGEGQGVTIRGVQPDQNLTLLNGQAVGTSQWFVLSDATRNFNFELLASEMISGLEVYKTSQADIDEGALGGTVILHTRKPLDLEANTFNASVEGQYGDLSEEWDPGLSGLYSWKNEEETFGMLVSASYQKRSVRRETTEDFGWFGPSIERIDPLMEPPKGADEKGATPWGIGSALFEQERERVGYDVTAQWAPTDELDMTLHYLSSTMKADNVNSNLIGIPFRGVAFLGEDTNEGTVTNGIVDSLDVTGLPNRPGWARHMAYDNIFRDGSEMSTQVIDFDGNYSLDTGKLHWQLGMTEGKGTNRDFFTEFWVDATDPRAAFDFTNPGGTAPAIDFTGASPWLENPGDEMWLGGIFDQLNETTDKETYAQLDYSWYVDFGGVQEIKVGGKYRDRSMEQNRWKTDLSGLDPIGAGSLGPASDFWSGDMVNVSHSDTSMPSQSYFMPDRDTMYNALYAVNECTATSAGLCRNTDVFQGSSSFDVAEKISALYAMAKFDVEGVRGNVGLRYVETDTTSEGTVAGDPVKYESDYSEWLPSINIAYDLSSDVILRAAASRALTRPAPFQLAPAVNLTPETSSGSAGNPFLEPLTAAQYELGAEWYFTPESVLGLTAFKKDISNFIYTTTVSAVIEGEQINQLRTPVNGGNTSIDGVEFQMQHAFDNGFGGYVNYTYTDVADAKVTEAVLITNPDGSVVAATQDSYVELPNTSKNSYNLGAYYEDDLFSARVNYNYRSEYFLAKTEIGNQYRDEQQQVDAQLSWNATENITISFEALNITNEIWENYYERDSDGARLGGTQSSNGRRYYLGASFRL
ncbi:TonB-dependent receptor [Shewanella sp. c952]|uniref:TonB-dependent receptor n=1 Tax=Shewanella sp. c952 TaxID=2815913 RepID=UPI001BC23095|nr:TonB-dependent receptor [Shewanella sp. c952]GIU09867.1 TonB-dependent receptor [Shewanella sp. c952]